MFKKTTVFLLLLVMITATACGRYGDLEPPEAFSPEAVSTLKVSADNLGVTFSWDAPDKDQRSKELRQINGYRIYRKALNSFERILDDQNKFLLVSEIEDTHILERDRLRKEAIAEGRVGRRIDVDAELKKFKFTDNELVPGFNYVYKIVPYNQSDVEGLVKNFVKIKFLGATSIIAIEPNPEASPQLGTVFY